jgi:FixJ family two-component response regulator
MSQATPIVFVVDDDISMRESLELLIRCEGWQPQIFASAQEFLSRPRAMAPSCLILDVNLPDLNGLDLQKRVSADRTDMPIIFITGHGDVPMTVKAMKAGAIEFLTKPFRDRRAIAELGPLSYLRDRVRGIAPIDTKVSTIPSFNRSAAD